MYVFVGIIAVITLITTIAMLKASSREDHAEYRRRKYKG